MDSDVDEGSECRHVGDRAFQHHARTQVGEGVDALWEHGRLERRAWVASGFLQRGDDVGDGGQAVHVVDEVSGPECVQCRGVADQLAEFGLGGSDDPAHDRVGLGVHAGGVERVIAAADTEGSRRIVRRPVADRAGKASCREYRVDVELGVPAGCICGVVGRTGRWRAFDRVSSGWRPEVALTPMNARRVTNAVQRLLVLVFVLALVLPVPPGQGC